MQDSKQNHKSGFVNIIGKPNAGKSTLMNALVGERMSIITAKPQTTRHRIMGILSGEDFQIVFSDTPGLIDKPRYKMQETMNNYAYSTLEDADLMLLVTDPSDEWDVEDPIVQNLKQLKQPVFLVVNKMDITDPALIKEYGNWWKNQLTFAETVQISALHAVHTKPLLDLILEYLPSGPAYYPKDQLTDRSERFFVSEIIREKILEQYHQEIPYSTEVIVESFKEGTTKSGQPITRISATIYVMRDTQKSIIIGKGGTAIKSLGSEARKSIQLFLDTKIFLELIVKVSDNWRDNDRSLKHFGYGK